jgi:hypothetical protein
MSRLECAFIFRYRHAGMRIFKNGYVLIGRFGAVAAALRPIIRSTVSINIDVFIDPNIPTDA